MSKITEVRLTLAALIYGLEIDLKSTINRFIVPFYSDLSFIKDTELEEKIISRYQNVGFPFLVQFESRQYYSFFIKYLCLN